MGAFPVGYGKNIGFARSTDNGVTFGARSSITSDFFTMDQVLGNDRVNNAPSLAVDNSPGAFRGNVYVTYSNNNNIDGADVVVQRSTDQGVTFSTPVRVNSRPGHDRAQWFPWVTVDKTTGRVYVFYYDQGIATDGDLTETTFVFSDDGGVTWSRPAPLTVRPFHAGWGNDTGQPNLGDYNQAVAQVGDAVRGVGGHSAARRLRRRPAVDVDDGARRRVQPPARGGRRRRSATRLRPSRLSDAGDRERPGGNGFIDPGDTVKLTIALRNYVTRPDERVG